MKKKLVLVLLVLCLLMSACQRKEATFKKDVKIEGSIFSGVKQSVVNSEVVFDDSYITTNDNKEFNSDLARFASLLATDCYFREKDVEKGNQNRVLIDGNVDDYDYSMIFKAFGFDDVSHIESFKQKEYDYDINDSVTMNLAYKNVDDKYDAFIVVVRGCFSAGEWSSVFDVGSPSVDYFNVTGKHPEWEKTSVNKDIEISSNRARAFIEEFVSQHDTDRPNTMLLTGHSRGATIVNELGSEFEEENYAKTFTYCFNPMNYTLDSKDVKSVFNVFDSNDFFTDFLPFKNEVYKRNGIDVFKDLSANEELQNKIKELTGSADYICVSKEFMDDYKSLFAKMFPDRNSLYTIRTIKLTFDKQDLAETKMEELVELVDDSHLNLADYILFSLISEVDGKYEFEVEYFGHTLLLGLSKILIYGNSANDALQVVFEKDEDICKLYQLVSDNLLEIKGGHYIVNDYVQLIK